MATILLSAAGAALGGTMGGTVAGLSTAVLGRAAGATLGRAIDQRLMGQGSEAIETGRVDRFRLMSASEGDPMVQLYGRMRVGGEVIWASEFAETAQVSGGGGKGAPSRPKTRSYSYSVSLAIALCEGRVTRIGRIWANGEEIAPDDLNLRLYHGDADQAPDPLMEAIEGAGQVPAYRGTAYVVIENLALEPFGNRVPQFSFEVTRPEQPGQPEAAFDPVYGIRGVTMIPGTGEYALATTPVHYSDGVAARQSANINTPAAKTDFCVAMDSLRDELPNCGAASLVVSWFGNDLRCGECAVRPKVESRARDGVNMPWSVSGLTRSGAEEIAVWEGRPIYGGTPSDASVIEAITALREAGKAVMFYPFILMEQLEGNTLPDPYDPAGVQPRLPWRGRITLSLAPDQPGTPDRTPAAAAQVADFVGAARAADFTVSPGAVSYGGPAEWTFSRFVLHYAALAAAAGGVDAFCIGSELCGLTRIRGGADEFVFVQALRRLAGQVRQLLGPQVRISYAADWSEYSGMEPPEAPGDWRFHLDELWADDDIDFIGIDNYMPLSDWREGSDHADAGAGSIYDLGYLRGNIAGGEGYDWFYASNADRSGQLRTPITDPAYDEPWVYRYKDIEGWWSNAHHDRIGGQRSTSATGWQSMSKPVWFTELGCAAVDKGTNQPNKFLDPRSSESSLPWFSTSARDDLIQMQYLRAMFSYWGEAGNNPLSPVYSGPMVDMDRAFVWALDLRPFPYFPNNISLWNDGENYARGHWINGRISARSLASVVAEICTRAGIVHFDVSRLYGLVRGYVVSDITDARAALQPLMLRYGFDAVERSGVLVFGMRAGQAAQRLERVALVQSPELDGTVEQMRAPEAEMAGRVRVRFVQADSDFDVMAEEAVLAQGPSQGGVQGVSSSEMPLALTRAEGRQTAERWLTEARLARDTIRFALPRSLLHLGAGDVVELPADQAEGRGLYRIDRVEYGPHQLIEAVRIEPQVYVPADLPEDLPSQRAFVPPLPVTALFLDLPLMRGDEPPHAPHIAVGGTPWPGNIAVYGRVGGAEYDLRTVVGTQAIMGVTQTPMRRAPTGIFDHGPALEVKLAQGALSAATQGALLAGANLAAIGDGSPEGWELFQFEHCTLVAPGTYALSRRLRGQFGTEAMVPDVWPEGVWFVLINDAVDPLPMAPSQLDVLQDFRIGPARRPLDDPAYQQVDLMARGAGLRPYAPCHLAVRPGGAGALDLSWIRRSRIDGDHWGAGDIPLSEDHEAYEVRVMQGGAELRRAQTDAPRWVYDALMQGADGASGMITFEVAQLSSRFGLGPAARIEADL